MGNGWNFELLLGDESSATDGPVDATIEALTNEGFRLLEQATLCALGGLRETTVERAEAIEMLRHEGGIVTVWRGEEDMNLLVAPGQRISIYTDYDIRPEVQGRLLASRVTRVLLNLCDSVMPPYAWVHDEYRLESAMGRWCQRIYEQHCSAVRRGAAPRIVAPLNYFGRGTQGHDLMPAALGRSWYRARAGGGAVLLRAAEGLEQDPLLLEEAR